TCPLWRKTLAQWWPMRDGKAANEISLLAQIFGYLLVPWTSLQKYFLFYGPGRSGKGTIMRLLAKLLGKENYAAPSIGQLGKDFGLASLIGKLAALISETEFGRNDDPVAVTAQIKKITGEDDIEAQRKFKPNWLGRLVTRFVMSTNKL